jgi:hypothetical protein
MESKFSKLSQANVVQGFRLAFAIWSGFTDIALFAALSHGQATVFDNTGAKVKTAPSILFPCVTLQELRGLFTHDRHHPVKSQGQLGRWY